MEEKIAFLICPVRDVSAEESSFLDSYVKKLESEGYKVHWPKRDTNQTDPTGGYKICTQNYQAIVDADEIHIYWTKKSQGSLFDLGMTFVQHKQSDKPIHIVNRKDVETIVLEEKKEKSFEHVLLMLDNQS